MYIWIMKLMVTGSRNWNDYSTLMEELDQWKRLATELLHGGAGGADQMADRWAKENGVAVRMLEPDYAKHKAAAPHVRNTELVKQADGVLAFWDGQSKGTASTIAKARHAGKLLRIVFPPRRDRHLKTAKPAAGEQLRLF